MPWPMLTFCNYFSATSSTPRLEKDIKRMKGNFGNQLSQKVQQDDINSNGGAFLE